MKRRTFLTAFFACGMLASAGYVVWKQFDTLNALPVFPMRTSVQYLMDFDAVPASVDRFVALSRGGRVILLTLKDEEMRKVSEFTIPDVDLAQGCGAFSLTFDRDFARNQLFYVLHCTEKRKMRISRFVFDSKSFAATLGTKALTFETPETIAGNAQFMIGNLLTDRSGNLLFGLGDFNVVLASQDLRSHLGKILRIRPDASAPAGHRIPDDNPHNAQTGKRSAVYAYGLRAPWRIALDTSDILWIADVRAKTAPQAIFRLQRPMANFGWGLTECKTCETPWKTWDAASTFMAEHLGMRERSARMRVPWVGLGIDGASSGALLIGDWCTSSLLSLSLENETYVERPLPSVPIPVSIAMLGENVFIAAFSSAMPPQCFTERREALTSEEKRGILHPFDRTLLQ